MLVLFILERSQDRERESSIGRFREFSTLAEEYRMIEKSGVLDKGKGVSDGLIPTLNALFDSLGLRDRVKSLRVAGNREFKGFIEESVQMEMDKLTMNELINLLYRIENHTVPISIKDVRMKKDFENPERIDLNMKVSLFRAMSGQ